jgi:hypothetical protein
LETLNGKCLDVEILATLNWLSVSFDRLTGQKNHFMSRGFGAVQRKIAEILTANPDDGFTVPELCWAVYGVSPPEKRHRVSVLRAAKALMATRPEIGWTGASGYGLAFFNITSVMSYARARIKATRWASDIDTLLAPGGSHYNDIVEGGEWWLRVQVWIARQDNDTARLAELQPMIDAERQKIQALMAMFRRG